MKLLLIPHQIFAKRTSTKPSTLALRPSAAFTLVELLLYMGLLSIFLLVLTDLLVSTLDVRSESTGAALVSSEGEYIRARLLHDIRRASSITQPASPGQESQGFSVVIDGGTYSYDLSTNELQLDTGTAIVDLHSDSTRIASFSATRIGNGTGEDTLQIIYTIESTTLLRGQTAESQTFTFVGGLR